MDRLMAEVSKEFENLAAEIREVLKEVGFGNLVQKISFEVDRGYWTEAAQEVGEEIDLEIVERFLRRLNVMQGERKINAELKRKIEGMEEAERRFQDLLKAVVG